jgi:uncharacterized membrane protein
VFGFGTEELLNGIALFWLLLCWGGYTLFAKRMAKRTHSLSSLLHEYRIDWMRGMLARDVRVGDASLFANLERSVNFFASTTMLILAGILTVLTKTGDGFTLFEHLPFTVSDSLVALQMKLLVLVSIFVYAFFTFTWSMRQYGFCNILVGSAPLHDDESVSKEARENYAFHLAKVSDQAAHSYNYGLRSYYFAMAVISWFASAWLFIAAVTFVVIVLYRREFLSKPLRSMQAIHESHLL